VSFHLTVPWHKLVVKLSICEGLFQQLVASTNKHSVTIREVHIMEVRPKILVIPYIYRL